MQILATEGTEMKFMVMVRANAATEGGELPSTEMLTAMGKYNEELAKAGLMLRAGVRSRGRTDSALRCWLI